MTREEIVQKIKSTFPESMISTSEKLEFAIQMFHAGFNYANYRITKKFKEFIEA